MKPYRPNQEGFTLIELVTIIVIISILAMIALPKFINLTAIANKSRAETNADVLQTMYSSFMAQSAVTSPASPYPTLNQLVGAHGFIRAAIPSGWSSNSAPPASAPATGCFQSLSCSSNLQEVANYFCAPFAYDPAIQPFVVPDPASGFLLKCLVVSGPWTGWEIASSNINWQCPTGYGNPNPKDASGPSCSVTAPASVACPTGYSVQSGGCRLIDPADVGSGGSLPLALDNSGVCVGAGLKAPTFSDAARTIATIDVTSQVLSLDLVPAPDATHCPDSMFP